MRNPLNRPMLAVLLAAGVISMLDADSMSFDEPTHADVRFAPLVRNGHEVGLKVLRGKQRTRRAPAAPAAPRRARPNRPGSSALPS